MSPSGPRTWARRETRSCPRRGRRSGWSARAGSKGARRAACPAASASASRSRESWPWVSGSCCSTSRRASSIPEPPGGGVRVEGACKGLGDTDALHDVPAAFPRGRVTAVTGPNGAGKTTLALAACGLLPLDRGAVTRSGRAGYVAQDPACYLLHDTAAEEVEYGLRNLGVPAAERAARVAAELAVHLTGGRVDAGELNRVEAAVA